MSWAGGLGRATMVVGLCVIWASASRAQTYVCPPAPTGVPGLLGGPQFAATNPPDAFASQLADPRWTGAWREDFGALSTSQVASRILNDGSNLFLSLQAIVDPDGAQVGGDGFYVGFSKDGTTGMFVSVVMDAVPPAGGFVNDATSISSARWWKTTDGGNSPWPRQGLPQTWAGPAGIHIWTGNGTGNGASWGYNVELSLADLGAALGLGGPLTPPFYMWYEIVVETPTSSDQYSWPAGSAVAFDTTTSGCTPAVPCAGLLIAEWGIVQAPTSINCPAGISIDATHIGTTPLVAGLPGTTAFFGSGQPGNDFVAELTNSDSLNPLTRNAIQARFRIAGWPAAVGVGGSWTDLATTGTPAVPVRGANGATAGEISLPCVNPPFGSATVDCYQPPTGAPATQGLLVELSQNNGSGYRFVHDSAWVDMSLINPSTATGGAGGGGAGSGGSGGAGGAGGSGGAAGGVAGSGGLAGAAGGRAGTGGIAGAAGSGGTAGAAGGKGGSGGSAGGSAGGQGGHGGQSGAGAAAGSAGGQSGAAGAGGQPGSGGAAGAGGQPGSGGAAGAGGQSGAGGAAGTPSGQSGSGGAGGRASGGAGGSSPGVDAGNGAHAGGASGSTGGGSGCSCDISGSAPADSFWFLLAGLVIVLRRHRPKSQSGSGSVD